MGVTLNAGETEVSNFHDFAKLVSLRLFSDEVKGKNVFRTNAPVYKAYLEAFDPEMRQRHTCSCCNHFLDNYGTLAYVNEHGGLTSALWNIDVPSRYQKAVDAMASAVERSSITSKFFTDQKRVGTEESGNFNHLFVEIPKSYRSNSSTLSLYQRIAHAGEDFNTVRRAVDMIDVEHTREALRLFNSDSLLYSAKFVYPTKWFLELQERVAKNRNAKFKDNVVWDAIAAAPPGYCHIRTSILGVITDHIKAGDSFERIKRSYLEKTNSTVYQRPVAAPSSATVQQAEALVEKMGVANSLKRRFARPDELENDAIWLFKEKEKPAAKSKGVFSQVNTKESAKETRPLISIPAQTMTWHKFSSKILPEARRIEILVPLYSQHFIAMLTAEDFDAPPILKWDRKENRNPFSWYVYNNARNASYWNLRGGEWCNVLSILPYPTEMRGANMAHIMSGAILLLNGAKDISNGSLALFPQILDSEIYGVRSVIEKYSQQNTLPETDEPTACGFCLPKDGKYEQCLLRTVNGNDIQHYKIDRWD